MKRFVSAICVAAALLLPAKAEAGTIYVGALDYCEIGACLDASGAMANSDAYIDVLNLSSLGFLFPGYEHAPGSMNNLLMTVESDAGFEQFVFGKDSCNAGSGADFFAAVTPCVVFEPLHVDESARLLFSAFSISGFLSARLQFTFGGYAGDMFPLDLTAVDYTAELTATRAAPEPASLLLLGTGALLALRRRRPRR